LALTIAVIIFESRSSIFTEDLSSVFVQHWFYHRDRTKKWGGDDEDKNHAY